MPSIFHDKIITVSPIVYSNPHHAHRFVIRELESISDHFAVYREGLVWSDTKSDWDHSSFYEGQYSSSYQNAMKQFINRLKK